jgi:hypothetical protein
MEEIDAMPESTPEEIAAKKEKYETFCAGPERKRLIALADIRTAQFFIPKTEATEPVLCTHAGFRTFLQGNQDPCTAVQGKKAAGEAVKRRFFHWFLELNYTYHEEEAAGGLVDEKGKPVKKKKGKKRADE